MRCFIAINLPKNIKDYLFNFQNQIKSILTSAKIKFVAKKNLHLTLNFIGEKSENDIEQIKNILDNINFDKFSLQLKSFGIFPSNKFVRVLWVDIKNPKELLSLQKKIDMELLNFSKSSQEFKDHITLGRIKQIKNKDLFQKELMQLHNIKIESLTFDVTSFALMQSVLSKEGPEYIIIKEYGC